MDTSNVSFLLLVAFLAVSIVGVSMLPLQSHLQDPPDHAGSPTPVFDPSRPAAMTRQLELASLFLRDLESRRWEKLSVCLAAPSAPAALSGDDPADGHVHSVRGIPTSFSQKDCRI